MGQSYQRSRFIIYNNARIEKLFHLKVVFLFFLSLSCALLSFNVFASEERLKAGLAAMKREHYATALRAFRAEADEGDPQAQNNIGYMYEYGWGEPQDYKKAMEWYKKAAKKSLAEAEYNVGILYHNGYGVAKNNSEAKNWFEKAARKNFRDAEFMMGNIFQNGWGVKASPKRALFCFKKAAKQGLAKSQFMTGFLLLSGEINDEPEAVKGYAWTEVSRVNGYGGAQEVLDYASLSMKETQIKMAKALAKQCLASKLKQCP